MAEGEGDAKVSAMRDLDLPDLQNAIKRDPDSYVVEFQARLTQFTEMYEGFNDHATEENVEFGDLISFLGHLSHCYPDDLKMFPSSIISLLQNYYTILNHKFRFKVVKTLMVMRNKNQIDPVRILPLFFKLFRCQDKMLRQTIFSHIVNDIKRINQSKQNQKVNRELQNFIYEMIDDSNSTAAKRSLEVMIELYRKRVWNDAKTVNVMATATLSKLPKLVFKACQFFLSSHEVEFYENGHEEEEDDEDLQTEIIGTKKTKKKQNQIKRNLKLMAKRERKKEKQVYLPDFIAIDLIYDPQKMVDQLFSKLRNSSERYEIRIMMIKLIARLVGRHSLFLFNFYPYLHRYLKVGQKEVTQILAAFAEACHELVPPAELEPSVRCIADNFVTERSHKDAVAMGLNAIREICQRCPLVMSEGLLQDLVDYRSFKNKGVKIAAKSLMNLFRELAPKMLKTKDRGKVGKENGDGVLQDYAQNKPASGIAGVDLLVKQMMAKERKLVEREFEEQDDEMVEGEEDAEEVEEIEGEDQDGEVLEVDEEDGDEEIEIEGEEDDEDDEEEEGDEDDNVGTKKTSKLSKKTMRKKRAQMEKDIDKEIERRKNELMTEMVFDEMTFTKLKKLKIKASMLEAEVGARKKKEVEIDDLLSENEEDDINPKYRNDPKYMKRYRESKAEELEEEEKEFGFIDHSAMDTATRTKREKMAKMREENPDDAPDKKFKHEIVKKGGLSNQEQLKFKPIMMVKPKRKRKVVKSYETIKASIREMKRKMGIERKKEMRFKKRRKMK
mmetsp:Transcript_46499/g.53605  ORF Transcript_46499/g.53605 Transcript_46499/m.53605 type:complete len:782 (-) Transcript_46499:135-2480(-)